MRSKINIAEGIKREAVLNGEGEASKILQEARSLCESLTSISKAIASTKSGGAQDSEALNLRLSEQYLDALSEILSKSSILMTPSNQDGAQGMAEIMTMYKHIVGGNQNNSMKMARALQAGNTDPSMQKIMQELEELRNLQAGGINAGREKGDNYKYLDDKTLYSTDG